MKHHLNHSSREVTTVTAAVFQWLVFQWLAISIGHNHIGSSLIVTRDVVLNVVKGLDCFAKDNRTSQVPVRPKSL